MSKTDHKPLFDVVFSLLANEPGKDNEFFPTGRALCTLQLNQRGFTTVTFKIMRRTPRWSLPGCANHEGPRAPRAGPSAGGRGTGPPPRDAAAGQDAPQNPCPGRSCGTGRPPEPLPGTRPRDTKLPPPQEPLPRASASLAAVTRHPPRSPRDGSPLRPTGPRPPPGLPPARAARRAHRVFLRHHPVCLLGSADHLVLHGPGRPAPRRAAGDGKRAELAGRRVSPGVGNGPQQA